MSVRKRIWTTSKGVEKEAWVVDYVDQSGKRRLKTCVKKKDADRYEATSRVEVMHGTHTADSASVTTAEAGKRWIESARNAGLERSTVEQYEAHLKFHIVPFLGRTKLSQLSAPTVREFEDRLMKEGTEPGGVDAAPALARHGQEGPQRQSLGADRRRPKERGLVARNVVRDLRARRKRGKERQAERQPERQASRSASTFRRPPRSKAIVGALQGRWRLIMLTAIFTGLRASELRGHPLGGRGSSRRRNCILAPARETDTSPRSARRKSGSRGAGRSVDADRLERHSRNGSSPRPRATSTSSFPIEPGNDPEPREPDQAGARARCRSPPKVTVTEKATGRRADPFARNTRGSHALRHFYASWCINAASAGGLGLAPKVVQERLGHSSIMMTMDTYGHLFERGDDSAALAAAERSLLA